MDKILIKGGLVLQGEVAASGAKNAILPLMFSTILAEGVHHFEQVPNLMDVQSANLLLQHLGLKTQFQSGELVIESKPMTKLHAPYELVRKMRASILCLGPLLARHGEAIVSLPGGCAIGTRPIDLHLEALQAMGAEIVVEEGNVHAKAKKLKGARISFETATVGGTENIMMAASLADGETLIENAAKEPEIVDLANYLRKMGARIEGEGTALLKIQGVQRLHPPKSHRVISDRIEAGTLLIAGAITGGNVLVRNINPSFLESLLSKLREAGCQINSGESEIELKTARILKAVDVTTGPHPAFPTDLQAQLMALMSVAQGTSIISETVFENRFMHVQELVRLNADITSKSRVAIVRGRPGQLKGAPVMATDLRASASLVLAGLAAQGETLVQRIYHLDRGYENLEAKLRALGASIERIGSAPDPMDH